MADYQVQYDLHLYSSPGFPLTPSVFSVTPPSVDLEWVCLPPHAGSVAADLLPRPPPRVSCVLLLGRVRRLPRLLRRLQPVRPLRAVHRAGDNSVSSTQHYLLSTDRLDIDIMFPRGPCANCKYCKGGVAGCKTLCRRGKNTPTCKACQANCA